MTYQEFISISCQVALAGLNPLKAEILDVEMTAEALVPIVFQDVALACAADPEKRSLLRRTHAITFTNGVGAVPDAALTQCWNGASISSATDLTIGQLSTYVPYKQDFIQPRDNWQRQLNWWHVDDVSIYFLEANEDYDPSSGLSGSLNLLIASVPLIPATAATTLDVADEVLSDLLEALAVMLRDRLLKKVAA